MARTTITMEPCREPHHPSAHGAPHSLQALLATSVFSVSSSTTHTFAHNHSAHPADVMRDVALKAILKKVKGNEERV
jgi:hypothetical protein